MLELRLRRLREARVPARDPVPNTDEGRLPYLGRRIEQALEEQSDRIPLSETSREQHQVDPAVHVRNPGQESADLIPAQTPGPRFDDRAHASSIELWLRTHRELAAVLGVGLAGALLGVFPGRGEDRGGERHALNHVVRRVPRRLPGRAGRVLLRR